ncbi:DUF308 domain-containing protein [Lentisphaerota bacterium ZTH]|nr:DUF308 domain-containing protein [Lentisphaerota bacterium]WET07635.1 DUF308 domain-containing protein [Lentisphaerota bacterium ZTH]
MSNKTIILGNFFSSKLWGVLLVRGIISALIGLIFIIDPISAMFILALFLGVFLLLNGILVLVNSSKAPANRGVMITYGVVSLIAGALVMLQPFIAQVFFLILIAIWAIFTGVEQLMLAARAPRTAMPAKSLAVAAGVISLFLGLLLLLKPSMGITMIAWVIGIYLLIYGLFTILVSVFLRKIKMPLQ